MHITLPNTRKSMPRGMLLRAFLFVLYPAILFPPLISAREPLKSESTFSLTSADTLETELPEIEVSIPGRSRFRKGKDGSLTIRREDMTSLIRTFGEADFTAQIKRLAGVANGSDYAAGLSIDGADPTQTRYILDGVQVIFPYRFGGIFSSFNSTHFGNMKFEREGIASTVPNLGSVLEFESSLRMRRGCEGSINIGLLSSSATIRIGIDNKAAIGLSGRVSYIDKIYGRLLSARNSTMQFSFSDFNINGGWRVGSNDLLSLSMFHSSDNTGYKDRNYSMNTGLRWTNSTAGLSWSHEGTNRMTTSLYMSSFRDRLQLDMPQFRLSAPSKIRNIGALLTVSGNTAESSVHEWEAGSRIEMTVLSPLWATLTMKGDPGNHNRSSEEKKQNALTGIVFARYRRQISDDRFEVQASITGGVYGCRMKNHGIWATILFVPRLAFGWNSAIGKTVFSLSRRQQPIHQVGFSELGLASDFHIGSCAQIPVQNSLVSSIAWYSRTLWNGIRAEAHLFWAKVSGQSEYRGQVMEVITTDYDPFSCIITSHGHNYGLSIGFTRDFGNVTGEISYSYESGRRWSDKHTSSWRNRQSAGNIMKANAEWHVNRHWTVSGQFILADGRPYTPVKALYAIAGNIAMEYGERNSARLPAYQRLDIGATYRFTTNKSTRLLTHLVNFSIINVLGHRNIEMQYFILNSVDGSYKLKRLYSLYRFMPSLSYTLDF